MDVGIPPEKWIELSKNWPQQEPPAVPSLDDLNNFELLASKLPEAPKTGIVLGATPSLRTLLSLGLRLEKYWCVDFSTEAYDSMTAHMGQKPPTEHFIKSDWVKLSSTNLPRVDIILGDKALDNVSLRDWPAFFSGCASKLSNNGGLILHVAFPDLSLKGIPLHILHREWVNRRASLGLTLEQAASGLWEDLLSSSSGRSPGFLSLEPFRTEILSQANPEDPDCILQFVILNLAGDWSGRWADFQKEDVISAASLNGLTLTGMELSSDYIAAHCQPIMLFRLNC